MLSKLKQFRQSIYELPDPTGWKKALQILFAVSHTVNRAGIRRHAAVLTYQTLLTIVPLLAILFTLLKMFGIDVFLHELLLDALQPLGQSGQEIGHYLLQFIRNTETNLLGSLGVFFLLLSIFSLFRKIDQALNNAWALSIPNNWRGQILGYTGAILLTIIIGLLAVTLNLSARKELLQILIRNQTIALLLLTAISKIAAILVTALMLAIIYSATLNVKVRFHAAFSGGLFCAILWIPLTFIFAKTIAVSSNYSVIYSSFASMIILLIWLNTLWLLFLSGSLLSYFVQFPALLHPYSRQILNAAEIEHFMIMVLNYLQHSDAPTRLSTLINLTHLNHRQLYQVLTPLINNQQISKTKRKQIQLLTTDKPLTDETIHHLAYGQIKN